MGNKGREGEVGEGEGERERHREREMNRHLEKKHM